MLDRLPRYALVLLLWSRLSAARFCGAVEQYGLVIDRSSNKMKSYRCGGMCSDAKVFVHVRRISGTFQ